MVRKGTRFLHSRVLDTMKFDGKTPQLYVVTKVTKGAVYFRPVYNYGTREGLGGAAWCPSDEFPRWCKQIVT